MSEQTPPPEDDKPKTHPKTGVGSAGLGQKPPKLYLSILTRDGRKARYLERAREVYRRSERFEQRTPNEEEADRYARMQFIRELERHAERAGFGPEDRPARPAYGTDELIAYVELLERIVERDPHRWKPDRQLAAERLDGREDHTLTRAIRRSKYGRALRKALARRVHPNGKKMRGPKTDLRMALGVFEAMIFEHGDLELERQWAAHWDNHLIRAWAYDLPCRPPANGEKPKGALSYGGVIQSLTGELTWERNEWGEKVDVWQERLGILDHHDPDTLIFLNVAAIKELIALTGNTNIGRRVSIDGMKVRASRLQIQSASPHEEKLINRVLNCAVGSHGRTENWRGWAFLALVDHETGLALGWVLINANVNENEGVRMLLETIYRHWPDLRIDFFGGDREYDRDRVCEMLECCFGIHPVFPRRLQYADIEGEVQGCPVCCGELMRYVQADFYGWEQRQELKLEPRTFPAKGGREFADWTTGKKETAEKIKFEVDGDTLIITTDDGKQYRYAVHRKVGQNNQTVHYVKLKPGDNIWPFVVTTLIPRPHIRWVCTVNEEHKKRTYPDEGLPLNADAPQGPRRKGWRRHTWVPFLDVHKPKKGKDRYRIREEVLAYRNNASEGFNSRLRQGGIGTDGSEQPRVVKTFRHQQWLIGGRALAVTLRRLVQKDGSHAAVQAEAEARELLRPPTLEELGYLLDEPPPNLD